MKRATVWLLLVLSFCGCGHQPTTLYQSCHDTDYEFYSLKVCADERDKILEQSIMEKQQIENQSKITQMRNNAPNNGVPWYFWALLPFAVVGAATDLNNAVISSPHYQAGGLSYTNTITPNAYGLGTHMNQYGQPVRLQPSTPDPYGNYGDSYIKTPNAYGLGIHMDQYGRPVTAQPK